MKSKKYFGVFLSLLMIVSFMLQGLHAPAHAAELGSNVITSASIAKIDGSPMTGTIAAWQPFRINVNYKLPNNTVHEGDTTTITLPAGIVPASPSTFQIKDGSNVVANGKLVDGNPTKVILTYTKYVEEKSDLQGKFFFNAQIDNKVHNTEKTIPVNLAVNGETIPAGELHYKPKTIELLPILKAGWMWSQDSTVGIYQIKINQKNEAFVNAKVVDELLDPGVSYIQGSLKVYEGKWELTYGGTGLELKNKTDVTEHYKDKITYDGPKFTFDIGNAPAGKGLLLEYRVKIPYKPIAGEKFQNKATFTNNGQNYNHGVTYQIIEAGGSGEGYTYSLEINKMNPAGSPLKGATFDIIRVRSGKTVGTVETDANGYAKIGGLLHDDYKIHETKAPEGYDLAADMDVSSSDFDPVTKTVKKTIIDKEKTMSVSVEKKWVGAETDKVKVYLYADGADTGNSVILDSTNNWKDKFENLNKYNPNGTEIQYTVKEDIPNGYKSKINGSQKDGYIITNTEMRDIPVTKKWVGPEGTSVTIHLYAGDNKVDSVTLTKANKWQHTFKDLEKYKDGKEIEYTIKEDSISGYKSKISGDMASGFTVTNTNTEKTSVNVTKKWVGKAKDSVNVKLFADGKEKQDATLSEATGWKHEFKNLPKYDEDDGHEIVYTVKEAAIDGYKSVISGTAQTGFTITNTITGKISIPVTKKWVGPEGTSATIHLYAGNEKVASAVLSKTNEWKYTFKDLEKYKDGKEIEYTIKEDSISGYKSKISGDMASGFTVTNTNTEKTSVNVTKKWVGKAKDSVNVKLFADGKEKQDATLSEATGWKHEFKNLPKYDEDDGHEIVYTVKEVKIAGYRTTISGNSDRGYIITNIQNKPNKPDTGDNNKVLLYMSMLMASLGGILFMFGKKRKAL